MRARFLNCQNYIGTYVPTYTRFFLNGSRQHLKVAAAVGKRICASIDITL